MFVIDANVFIQAANSYYAFDLMPPFWRWVEGRLGQDLYTVTPVRDEILKQRDELSNWFKELDDPAWVLEVDDEKTQLEFKLITQHCVNNGYKTTAVQKFLSGADPWIVARAKRDGWAVITQELPDPKTKKRVKIPDVCVNLGVSQMMVFEMLRKLGFSA